MQSFEQLPEVAEDAAKRGEGKMRKYQLLRKPNATATGEPGRWSFVAHGATYTNEEAEAHIALVEHCSPGVYKMRKLAV